MSRSPATTFEYLQFHADSTPDRVALIMDFGGVTYRRFADDVFRFTNAAVRECTARVESARTSGRGRPGGASDRPSDSRDGPDRPRPTPWHRASRRRRAGRRESTMRRTACGTTSAIASNVSMQPFVEPGVFTTSAAPIVRAVTSALVSSCPLSSTATRSPSIRWQR